MLSCPSHELAPITATRPYLVPMTKRRNLHVNDPVNLNSEDASLWSPKSSRETLILSLQIIKSICFALSGMSSLQELHILNGWSLRTSYSLGKNAPLSSQLESFGQKYQQERPTEEGRALLDGVLAVTKSMSQLHTLELVDKCSDITILRWVLWILCRFWEKTNQVLPDLCLH